MVTQSRGLLGLLASVTVLAVAAIVLSAISLSRHPLAAVPIIHNHTVESVVVPDVIGQSLPEAKAELQSLRVLPTAQASSECPPQLPANLVCGMHPSPGTTVSPGSAVVLFTRPGGT